MRWRGLIAFAAMLAGTSFAQNHSDHDMAVDRAGVVMNENLSALPRGCDEISRDYQLTIRAGRAYARGVPGMTFAMSEHDVRVEPCSRIEVTFVNEDDVRHQWMVHGLPKYLYPAGMFHLEASGGQRVTGTFIVPGEDRSYLVHCDIAQHMEKGMRGQLVVGSGSGDLWGVTGVSDQFYRSSYWPRDTYLWVAVALLVGFLASVRLARG
ncbi:MAG: hypothetical protein E2O54_09425 [Gammaproteobacteria bacterium]|nr:MAG: hypothetical protein E2O58_12060 [Gammaproteobacteria bacterium]TDJ39922.1 MAG: hypothetical protein E2O54_09425 [Gammaproteobacteria bacterium]